MKKLSDKLYEFKCRLVGIEPLYVKITCDFDKTKLFTNDFDIGLYDSPLFTSPPELYNINEKYSWNLFKCLLYYLKKQFITHDS